MAAHARDPSRRSAASRFAQLAGPVRQPPTPTRRTRWFAPSSTRASCGEPGGGRRRHGEHRRDAGERAIRPGGCGPGGGGDARAGRCAGHRRHGWSIRREVEITHERWHGWIDILAFHPGSRTLVIVEIKTQIEVVGAVERQLGWYERAARDVAPTISWRPTTIGQTPSLTCQPGYRDPHGCARPSAQDAEARRVSDPASVAMGFRSPTVTSHPG